MDSGKYEYCSETSSPALSSDEFPPATPAVHNHHHRSGGLCHSSVAASHPRSCSSLLMTTPGSSANSGSPAAVAMERDKEYQQQQREREREMSCSLAKQQRINECLRAAAAAAAANNTACGSSGGGGGGSSAGSDAGQGSSNSGCHNFMAQYERNLNFATVQLDDSDYGFPKKKTVRDPLSHRIIEKRRRDRMNNCLADLARLLPQASLRKGRGRIEKTEIVELAIKHLEHLQTHPCPHGDNCEYSPLVRKGLIVISSNLSQSGPSSPQQCLSDRTNKNSLNIDQEYAEHQYQQGYQECMNETMHFLVDRKGIYPGDSLCLQLVKHLAEKLNLRNAVGKVELCDSIEPQSRVGPCGKRMAAPCSGSMSNSGDERSDIVCNRQIEDKAHSGCSMKHTSMANQQKLCEDMMDEEHEHGSKSKGLGSVYDVEDDNRSCSSPTQLTIVESGVPPVSTGRSSSASPSPTGNGKAGSGGVNPIIPTIICTNSSSPPNRESPGLQTNSCNEHSPNESADEGSCASNDHPNRYKFKNTIKQRFTAEVSPTAGETKGDASMGGPEYLNPAAHCSSGNQFRSSNTSSRNSSHEHEHDHGSELEEDVCGNNAEVIAVTKQSSSQSQCQTGSSSVRSLLEQHKQQQQRDPEGAADKDKVDRGCKSPSPEMPFVSVVKMSTLIESDDESCSVVNVDQDRRKTYAKGDEEYESCDKLNKHTVGDSNPINLSKSACPAPLPIRPAPAVRADKGVPVFALSEQGQFYIPLTIHKSILEPFSAELEELDTAKMMNKLPLYPVTISVCFAPKCKNQPANSQSLAGKDYKLYNSSRKEEPLNVTTKAHESKLSQCLQGRIPPLTASSTIPDFNTICELERRKHLMEAGCKSNSSYSLSSAVKHVLNKYPQPLEAGLLSHSESEDCSIIGVNTYPRSFEESCARGHSRKHDREPERERDHDTSASGTTRSESRNSTSSSVSVGSIPFSTPNYLYPILLGACTPKIYQSKLSGHSTGTRSTSCHSQPPSVTQTSPPTHKSNSCSTSPILRKRCNPSVSPPPVTVSHRGGWRDSRDCASSFASAGAGGFHHPTGGIAIDVGENNNTSCPSSRNSSPGSNTHCDQRSMSKYAQFLEAGQQLWGSSSSNCGAGDSEMLKHTLLQARRHEREHDRGSSGGGGSGIRRSTSPKRSRKDEEAYSIPKIITLK